MKVEPRRMILAARAAQLNALGVGFHPMGADEVMWRISRAGVWAGPRDELEEDPSYRQLIPYLLVRGRGGFLRYFRPTAGAEARLHGLASIGVGGHVDLPDAVAAGTGVDVAATLAGCAERERDEEIGGHLDVTSRRWVGLLIADDPIVHRVHLGVVAVHDVEGHGDMRGDGSLEDPRFADLDELKALEGRMELWSAMLLPHLEGIGA